MRKKSNNRSISLLVLILLIIESFTYSKIYLQIYSESGGRFEDILPFIFPPIICITVLVLFIITSINNNKSVFLILLSMVASWGPLMLVPAFVDMTILKMMFNQSIIVQLLPFISIFIVILANMKYIGCLKIINKRKKITNI